MDEALYKIFASVERTHWWFVARRRIIEDQIGRVMGLKPGATILDAGCGTGGILDALQEKYVVSGMDISPTAVRLCHEAGLINVREGTFETDPFPGELFDCLLLLDVIEHIQDDAAALAAARKKLKPGGRVLVTVPAYQFLWSEYDRVNHHQRRYHHRLLRRQMETAGFTIERLSYFNAILFPLALVQRLVAHITHSDPDRTLIIPPPVLNRTLQSIFGLERILLRHIAFPYGLSLLAIARPA